MKYGGDLFRLVSHVVVLIGVAVLSHAIRRLFRFAGFGAADILLGIAVSAAKALLLLGLFFSAFDRLNESGRFAEPETLETSETYYPILWASDMLFPFLASFGEQVSADEEPQND